MTHHSALTPTQTSLLHLKLRPRGRQTAQHISWSQGCSTSPLISEYILRTSTPVWTMPDSVTNFIQLVFPQLVDQFSQTKLHYKATNEGYPHICEMYKSNNKWLRYQAISSCKSFVCQYLMNCWSDSHDWTCVGKCSSICFQQYIIHPKAISIGRDTSISM